MKVKVSKDIAWNYAMTMLEDVYGYDKRKSKNYKVKKGEFMHREPTWHFGKTEIADLLDFIYQ